MAENRPPAFYVYNYDEANEQRSWLMKVSTGGFIAIILLAWTFNIRGLVMAPQSAAQQEAADANLSNGLSAFSESMDGIKQGLGEFSAIRSAISGAASTTPATSSAMMTGNTQTNTSTEIVK